MPNMKRDDSYLYHFDRGGPGTNRLEISGTMGKNCDREQDTIKFHRNRVDERTFNKTFQRGFGFPRCGSVMFLPMGKQADIGILENIVNVLEKGEEPIADGREGILGLSISNAIHLSAWTDKWVEPGSIDEDLFYNILQDKIKNSTFKKNVTEQKTYDVRGTH